MATPPNRLKEFREQRGMSLAQMAEFIGYSKSQQHRFETGDDDLSLKWLRIIARKLGVKVSELLNDDDVEFRAGPAERQIREALAAFDAEGCELFLRAASDLSRVAMRLAPRRATAALSGDEFQVAQLADSWNSLTPDRREDALGFLRAAALLAERPALLAAE